MVSTMANEAQETGAVAESGLGPLPPYVQRHNFLPQVEHQRLLDWVVANRGKFGDATVHSGRIGDGNIVDASRRVARTTRKLGSLREMLTERLADEFAGIAAGTGYRGPPPTTIELEIAAHGDGAHFAPHVDIPIGPGRMPLSGNPDQDRVVSAVYYFYREPKAFSGGELRLFRFGASPGGDGQQPGNHVDIQPINNSLVAFPSWVRHEVRRVHCPGGDFAQYRFALNCWFCRPLNDARSASC